MKMMQFVQYASLTMPLKLTRLKRCGLDVKGSVDSGFTTNALDTSVCQLRKRSFSAPLARTKHMAPGTTVTMHRSHSRIISPY